MGFTKVRTAMRKKLEADTPRGCEKLEADTSIHRSGYHIRYETWCNHEPKFYPYMVRWHIFNAKLDIAFYQTTLPRIQE